MTDFRFRQRFVRDKTKRVYWCADCVKPFFFQNESVPFYGNCAQQRWSSLGDLIAKHDNGEVDAEWLCVLCVAKRQRRTDYGRVADEMGINNDRQRRNAQNADRRKRYRFDLPSNGRGW